MKCDMVGTRYLVVFGILLLNRYSDVEGISSDEYNTKSHRPGKNRHPGHISGDGIVSCYYTMWSVYRTTNSFGISDIPVDLCTHIVYSFIGPNVDGSVVFADPEVTTGGKTNELSALVEYRNKHNPELKIQVAMGGWSYDSKNFTLIVNNATLRAAFVLNLYNFVIQYGIDGVDMDWEYPGQRGGAASDKPAFVLLIKELKEKFGDLLVTAAVAVTQSHIDISYNVTELNKYLDHINLMTYDLHGSWDGVTGVIAPLYDQLTDPVGGDNLSVNKSVHTWINNGASPSKLVLGIPVYGTHFILGSLDNRDTGAPIGTTAGAQGPGSSYYQLCADQQANPSLWNITEVPGNYVYANRGLHWYGYDNTDTAYVKGQYARSLGLGGIMFWAIDIDDFTGACGPKFAIINAAKRGLTGH